MIYPLNPNRHMRRVQLFAKMLYPHIDTHHTRFTIVPAANNVKAPVLDNASASRTVEFRLEKYEFSYSKRKRRDAYTLRMAYVPELETLFFRELKHHAEISDGIWTDFEPLFA